MFPPIRLSTRADAGAIKLRDAILSRVTAGPQEIDMLHWFGRTALEFVGQSGLGEYLF